MFENGLYMDKNFHGDELYVGDARSAALAEKLFKPRKPRIVNADDDEPDADSFIVHCEEANAERVRAALPASIRQLAAQIVEADDDEAITLARKIVALVATPKRRPKMTVEPDPDDPNVNKSLVEASFGGVIQSFEDHCEEAYRR